MESRVSGSGPSGERTHARLAVGLACTKTEASHSTTDVYIPLYMSVILMLTAIIWHYWNLFISATSPPSDVHF